MGGLGAGSWARNRRRTREITPTRVNMILKDFRIIAESGEWIVVDKPPHLAVHPSRPGCGFTLWDGLRELLAFELANGGQVSLINRLDRETSGLTLIAKSRAAARALGLEMMARRVEKEYLALVWGWPAREEFCADARLLLPRHALHSAALRLPALGLAWASPLAPDLAAWMAENFLAAPGAPGL